MDTDIVKLNFTSPVHLGAEGGSVERVYDFLHSDTLFSSICHGWLEAYGRKDLERSLEEFPKNQQASSSSTESSAEPPFRLSSAFPFVEKAGEGGVQTTYFLPKLKKHPPFPDFGDEPKPREAKRVEKTLDDMDWVDLDFFWEWAAYRRRPFRSEDLDPSKWRCIQKRLDKMKGSLESAVRSDFRPRVTRDRRTGQSLLYFFGLLCFSDDQEEGKGGLYFLVKCRDQGIKNQLTIVLKLLGERGIGGERSSGYGRFEAEWRKLKEEWAITQTGFSDGRVTLSLYYPSASDLRRKGKVLPVYQYGLIRRAGWTSSPYQEKAHRRKVVRMFQEGTTFAIRKHPHIFGDGKIKPDKILGCLVDVASDEFRQDRKHPVYRYGIAFTLPIQLGGVGGGRLW